MPFDAPALPLPTLYRSQHTVAAPVRLAGVGVHSGQSATVTLLPAAVDHGIVFVRTDLGADATIPARYDAVAQTQLCTGLANAHGHSVQTIEHLMAALRGTGIDNARVEVDGPELPIMDGSAEPFVKAIDAAGITEQAAPRRAIEILRPVRVGDERAYAEILPSAHSEFSFEIDYPDTLIGQQRYAVRLVNGYFRREIAAARTFGLRGEVEQLRAMGFARGGSLANAIVVDGDDILNTDGLRFDDEFVRHKCLDAIGDLFLAGAPILGAYHGHRAGHRLNNELLHAIFASAENYRDVSLASVAA